MKGKKVTILMAMLALIMLSAVPAFAYEVEEGDNDHGYTHHRGEHSSELSGERRVQRW
ncbi:MAG TPA: hypothetical protein VEY13_15345 [Rubrobacteraceae bacterium]|nr:hypothetical protein [Rubrobacteraceae bacterium]